MTTILAVHGTFAGGPETGEKWWQKGSVFEKHINQLVEAEDGELIYQPIIWDGQNSETSRREAGLALFNKMKALDQTGEPYAVVGHSHGGSVIGAALMESAKQKKSAQASHQLDHHRHALYQDAAGTIFI